MTSWNLLWLIEMTHRRGYLPSWRLLVPSWRFQQLPWLLLPPFQLRFWRLLCQFDLVFELHELIVCRWFSSQDRWPKHRLLGVSWHRFRKVSTMTVTSSGHPWSMVRLGPPVPTWSVFLIYGPWSKLMVQWKVVSKPGLKWSSHILFKSAKSRSRRFFTKSSSIFTKFQSWIDAIIFTTRLHFGPMREKLKNCWSSYRISLVPPAKWIWIIRK